MPDDRKVMVFTVDTKKLKDLVNDISSELYINPEYIKKACDQIIVDTIKANIGY